MSKPSPSGGNGADASSHIKYRADELLKLRESPHVVQRPQMLRSTSSIRDPVGRYDRTAADTEAAEYALSHLALHGIGPPASLRGRVDDDDNLEIQLVRHDKNFASSVTPVQGNLDQMLRRQAQMLGERLIATAEADTQAESQSSAGVSIAGPATNPVKLPPHLAAKRPLGLEDSRWAPKNRAAADLAAANGPLGLAQSRWASQPVPTATYSAPGVEDPRLDETRPAPVARTDTPGPGPLESPAPFGSPMPVRRATSALGANRPNIMTVADAALRVNPHRRIDSNLTDASGASSQTVRTKIPALTMPEGYRSTPHMQERPGAPASLMQSKHAPANASATMDDAARLLYHDFADPRLGDARFRTKVLSSGLGSYAPGILKSKGFPLGQPWEDWTQSDKENMVKWMDNIGLEINEKQYLCPTEGCGAILDSMLQLDMHVCIVRRPKRQPPK